MQKQTDELSDSLVELLRASVAEEARAIESGSKADVDAPDRPPSRPSSPASATWNEPSQRLGALASEIRRIEARQRLWPLWTAVLCVTVVAASWLVLWATSWWMRNELEDLRAWRRSEARSLDDLEARGAGVTLHRSAEGTFLILPEGAERRRWTCGGRDCIKLPHAGAAH